MLARHPLAESTHHDRTVAQFVHERNSYLDPATAVRGQMMSLAASEEEGHVFDHEPGMSDYHHGHEHSDEWHRHSEYYEKVPYPVFLDHVPEKTENSQPHHSRHEGSYYDPYYLVDNDTESNLYRTYATYSPIVPHDWMLHKKDEKKRSFSDFDEFEFTSQSNGSHSGTTAEAKEDGLDFK